MSEWDCLFEYRFVCCLIKVGAALRPAFAVDTPADVTAMACEVQQVDHILLFSGYHINNGGVLVFNNN